MDHSKLDKWPNTRGMLEDLRNGEVCKKVHIQERSMWWKEENWNIQQHKTCNFIGMISDLH